MKLIPAFLDDFERFKASVEEVTTELVQTAKALELEMEPEAVTALLQSHDKNWTYEELLRINEKRNWLREMESAPGEDTVKIVGIMTKDLEYCTNLIDKSGSLFKRVDSNFGFVFEFFLFSCMYWSLIFLI